MIDWRIIRVIRAKNSCYPPALIRVISVLNSCNPCLKFVLSLILVFYRTHQPLFF